MFQQTVVAILFCGKWRRCWLVRVWDRRWNSWRRLWVSLASTPSSTWCRVRSARRRVGWRRRAPPTRPAWKSVRPAWRCGCCWPAWTGASASSSAPAPSWRRRARRTRTTRASGSRPSAWNRPAATRTSPTPSSLGYDNNDSVRSADYAVTVNLFVPFYRRCRIVPTPVCCGPSRSSWTNDPSGGCAASTPSKGLVSLRFF